MISYEFPVKNIGGNKKLSALTLSNNLFSNFTMFNAGYQSFPITSDRPDMSGKTEVGPTKYPATSDLQSGYFFGQFCFFGRFFGLTR